MGSHHEHGQAMDVGDPLAAVERALTRLGGTPRKNRAQRRAGHDGKGAGEGKHPLGATKPFRSERKAKARAKAKSQKRGR